MYISLPISVVLIYCVITELSLSKVLSTSIGKKGLGFLGVSEARDLLDVFETSEPLSFFEPKGLRVVFEPRRLLDVSELSLPLLIFGIEILISPGVKAVDLSVLLPRTVISINYIFIITMFFVRAHNTEKC